MSVHSSPHDSQSLTALGPTGALVPFVPLVLLLLAPAVRQKGCWGAMVVVGGESRGRDGEGVGQLIKNREGRREGGI